MLRTPSRRRALATAGTALLGSLAGCLDALPGSANDGTEDGTAFLASATPTGEYDRVDLDAVEAPGSPGGRITVPRRAPVTVVEFFATWCAPCEPQMDRLGEFRARTDPEQTAMVSVTTEDEPDRVRRFWREHDGAWPVAMDPGLAVVEPFAAKRLPTTVVVTEGGTEVARHLGVTDPDELVAEVRTAQERSA